MWNNVPLTDFFKSNYAKNIDNKVADLSWKIIHSGLTTAVKLNKWRVTPDSLCHSCDRSAVENTQHIFWLCPIAKRLWEFVTGLARQLGFHEPLSYVSVVTMDQLTASPTASVHRSPEKEKKICTHSNIGSEQDSTRAESQALSDVRIQNESHMGTCKYIKTFYLYIIK